MKVAAGTDVNDDEAALAGQLAAAGATLDMAALRDFVAGVIAAPSGHRPDAWIDLLVPQADKALRRRLLALVDEVAAAVDPGFGAAPAERVAKLRDDQIGRSSGGDGECRYV